MAPSGATENTQMPLPTEPDNAVVLDECLPVDFRRCFSGDDAHSAEWAGFKGKNNGELLRDAELAGYKVSPTVELGMPHQENLSGRKLSIISIRSRTNQLEDLLPFVADILRDRNNFDRSNRHGSTWVEGSSSG